MFNWLKKLFGKTESVPVTEQIDESHLAPYKVEPPVQAATSGKAPAATPKPSAAKKPRKPRSASNTGKKSTAKKPSSKSA